MDEAIIHLNNVLDRLARWQAGEEEVTPETLTLVEEDIRTAIDLITQTTSQMGPMTGRMNSRLRTPTMGG